MEELQLVSEKLAKVEKRLEGASVDIDFIGAKVRMLNTYPGMEGIITKKIRDGIYNIQTYNGIAIVTGFSSFAFIK